jgi:hypothetical protein
MNHWEGFGIEMHGRKGPDEAHRRTMAGWNLEQRLLDDLTKGVWIVTEDSREIDKPDGKYLDVLRGHFVRDIEPPQSGKLPACRYARACNNIDEGNVPESCLRKIELHDKGNIAHPPVKPLIEVASAPKSGAKVEPILKSPRSPKTPKTPKTPNHTPISRKVDRKPKSPKEKRKQQPLKPEHSLESEKELKLEPHPRSPETQRRPHAEVEPQSESPRAGLKLNSPKKNYKRKSESKPKPDVKKEVPQDPEFHFRSTKKPFFVYRAIQATFKTGSEANNDNFVIDGFEVQNGEFLLDCGDGIDTKFARARTVENIAGTTGKVPFCRLQLLLEPPWGLPDKLPILHDIEVTCDSTSEKLEIAAAVRDLSTAGSKDDIYNRIMQWEHENEAWLPLARMKKTIPIHLLPGKVQFQEGEIVRYEPGTEVTSWDTLLHITDYQGSKGWGRLSDMAVVGATAQIRIAMPFGLRLDPEVDLTIAIEGLQDRDQGTLRGENLPSVSKKRSLSMNGQ